MSKIKINSELLSIHETAQKIEAGEFLVIAGEESILRNLPSGNWMAGSIPYFMTESGAMKNKEKVFVNTIYGFDPSVQPRITPYDSNSISRIAQEAPKSGFSIIILPSGSSIHEEYAANAPLYENMFFTPIIGWISGVDLDDPNSPLASTFFGPGNMLMRDKAVVMHVPLPEGQSAEIKTINLFSSSANQKIVFPETGFSVDTCIIDGQTLNFADYIRSNNIDVKSPLVSDYNGLNVNVSIKTVNEDSVDLFAPVFSGREYATAISPKDYVEEFNNKMNGEKSIGSAFSCNCILNYLYSELDGKSTNGFVGPITFGEVGYQLMNQTLVFLNLD